MGLGDAPADRQTQTGAARAGGSSCIDPVEPLAEVRQVLRRDAFAGIRHRDGDSGLNCSEPNPQSAAYRLERVIGLCGQSSIAS